MTISDLVSYSIEPRDARSPAPAPTYHGSDTSYVDVVRRACDGDSVSFARLVEMYQPQVFRWALGLVRSRDDAEDVTQDVFVIAWRKLSTFRGDGLIDAWLYRITRRLALRARRRRGRRLLGILPPKGPPRSVYITDPGGRVDQSRLLALVDSAAKALPPRQRELFELCDLQGLAPTEAAALIGMKAVTARASLFKARAALRKSILRTHPSYQK
jgi:RNA polymerase sigma-70 factor (ECF subfamily)